MRGVLRPFSLFFPTRLASANAHRFLHDDNTPEPVAGPVQRSILLFRWLMRLRA